MSEQITELQRRPAHRWQSAEDSSLDAWFEGYPYYRSPERSISYYNKGEILGILLDLRIRQITHGKKSLRDVLQWMNEHYAKQHRFFPDSQGVEQAAEAITGTELCRVLPRLRIGGARDSVRRLFPFGGLACGHQDRAGRIGGVHHHGEPRRLNRKSFRLIPTAMPTGLGSLREIA